MILDRFLLVGLMLVIGIGGFYGIPAVLLWAEGRGWLPSDAERYPVNRCRSCGHPRDHAWHRPRHPFR